MFISTEKIGVCADDIINIERVSLSSITEKEISQIKAETRRDFLKQQAVVGLTFTCIGLGVNYYQRGVCLLNSNDADENLILQATFVMGIAPFVNSVVHLLFNASFDTTVVDLNAALNLERKKK
jgi:hypothetical protein